MGNEPLSLPPPSAPYRGIEPFRFVDQPIFSARTDEVQKLVRLITIYRGIFFYGESGAGKSSLINAGLIPALGKEGFAPEQVRVQPITGHELVVERIALTDEGTQPFLPSRFATSVDKKTPEPARIVLSVEEFVRCVGKAPMPQRQDDIATSGAVSVLIFDQFEELITLFEEAPESREKFNQAREIQGRVVEMLLGLLGDLTLSIKLVFSFREDYLAKVSRRLAAAPQLREQAVHLSFPPETVLRKIIRSPFESASIPAGHFTRRLSEPAFDALESSFRALSDTGTINLTEVQIACLALWENAEEEKAFLKEREHREAVRRLFGNYLDRALNRLEERFRRPAITALTFLVTSSGTRNIVSEEDLIGNVARDDELTQTVAREVLKALSGTTRVVVRQARGDSAFYEITSEFLIPWITEKRQAREKESARLLRNLDDVVSSSPLVKNPRSAAAALHELWARRAEWMHDAEAVHDFVRRALSAGEFLRAYDAARAAVIEFHPEDDWLKQRMALALAQMGSATRAQAILTPLAMKDPPNRETLSILGRTYKDQWCANPTNKHSLRQSFDFYNRAFEIEPPDFYPGINAATIAFLLGETEKAHGLARRVLEICQAQPEDYWRDATIAETLVILGDLDGAKKAYRAAVGAARNNLHALSSTRKQARVLSRHLQGRADFFDECFPVPKLVIFSGHMIDTPDRRVARFPLEKEDEIRKLLTKQLEVMNAGIGFASAACGSDILFLEAMLARGGTIHIVLPWPADEFVKTSVDLDGNGTWNKRFEAVLGRAASIRILGQLYMPGSAIGFEYCNLAVNGLARLFARSLDLDITPLAVWDGFVGGPGGTGSFVRYWRSQRVPVKVVPIATQAPSMLVDSKTSETDDADPGDEFEIWVRASGRQEIKAIMFADVVGYSKLPETVIPKYVAQFNQRVSRLIAESSSSPINVNTWGDGLFFVFSGAEDAGRFGLDLRDLVVKTDWVDLGLPHNLSIRIAVHAGPVYVNFDPIVRQMTFTGAHVSRAARIEPITHVGEVFASEEFAALAAADQSKGFTCDLVGTTALAKSYGLSRIYSLERVAD